VERADDDGVNQLMEWRDAEARSADGPAGE
jgi:hypothetical protein